MKAGRRKIKYDSQYDHCFGRPENGKVVRVESGNAHDTIQTILHVVNNYASQAAKISKTLKGRTKHQTAKNIYNFCYNYFQYKEDASGTDTVRTPNRAYADRKDGIDCDCYVALISCILTQYNWAHTIRMSANYDKDRFNHVYIILPDEDGKEICIDPVVDQFNREASYLHKNDTVMEVSYLNGLGNPSQRPMPNYTGNINIIDWIKKYEFYSNAKIRTAIATYAKRNGIHPENAMDILAKLLYKADKKRWVEIAKSNVVNTRSKRNFTIRSSDVLTYLGLDNSSKGLIVALLHDANILEIWMENTLNLPLASKIAEGILEYKRKREIITTNIPFKKLKSYTQHKNRTVLPCYNHCAKSKEIIYNEDPVANLLQLSILIGVSPKGKMIKRVNQMYKPDGSKQSNLLHEKLREVSHVRRAVRKYIPSQSRPLNGIFTAIGTAAGAAFGAPQVGAAIGSGVDTIVAQNKGKGNGYIPGETYVWPDGKAYDRSNTRKQNIPLYDARLEKFLKSKPYAQAIFDKYTEIKAKKGGVDPTLQEYNAIIGPFIKAEEQKIAQQKQMVQARKAQVAQVRQAQVKDAQKRKTVRKWFYGGVGAAALGTGLYLYFKD